MNTLRTAGLLALLGLFAVMQGVGQITITNSDMLTSYLGKRFIAWHDTLSASYNLGDASNGQSWDFSKIIMYRATARIDSMDFNAPAGRLRASSFPTAAICQPHYQYQTVSTYLISMMTMQYLEVGTGGVWSLGGASHVTVTPAPPPGSPIPADTVVVAYSRPKSLAIPLPLTNNGATYLSTDTLDIFGQGTQINEQKFVAAGSGTLTLPGGRSVQVIRMLYEQTLTLYPISGDPEVDYERYVDFLAQDGTDFRLHVPDAYTSGTTSPISFEYRYSNGPAAGVAGESMRMPTSITLMQNYPNPFNPSTTIGYSLPARSFVRIAIFDLLGREVAVLVNGEQEAGVKEARFDASGLSSGMYFYRLEAGNSVLTKKLLLMK